MPGPCLRHARIRRTDRRPAEGDRGALDAAADAERQRSRSTRLDRRIESIRGEIYPHADAVAARAGGAASEPADGARLRRTAVHRVHRDQRRSPLCRRSRDRHRLRALQGRAGAGRRPPEGQRGDTKQKIFRNFGYARPEGYRKALRTMKLAREVRPRRSSRSSTRRRRIRASSRRSAASPRRSRSTCARWRCSTCRSSSSCTAKAAAAARSALRSAIAILMHEFAIYSVIPPEGCAAILWRDASRKVEAAEALQADRAGSARASAIIDEIVPEPIGGAHTNHELAAALLDAALVARARRRVGDGRRATRLDARYQKFRAMGNVGIMSRSRSEP